VSKRIDLVTQAKGHTQDFILWPKQWKAYPGHSLQWQTFKFTKGGLKEVPKMPGVYAFMVKPNIEGSLEASYLYYIGKTTRTLRKRCQEYLRDQNLKKGRPRVFDLLSRFKGRVYFACAPVDPPHQVEDDLIMALIPPANSTFPAKISKITRVLR